MSVTEVTPTELRGIVVRRSGHHSESRVSHRTPLAVVEYHEGNREGLAARAMNKAANWMQRHKTGDRELPFLHLDAATHAAELDQLGIRVLPQDTTIAIYWSDGTTHLRQGSLVSSRELVRRLQAKDRSTQ